MRSRLSVHTGLLYFFNLCLVLFFHILDQGFNTCPCICDIYFLSAAGLNEFSNCMFVSATTHIFNCCSLDSKTYSQ